MTKQTLQNHENSSEKWSWQSLCWIYDYNIVFQAYKMFIWSLLRTSRIFCLKKIRGELAEYEDYWFALQRHSLLQPYTLSCSSVAPFLSVGKDLEDIFCTFIILQLDFCEEIFVSLEILLFLIWVDSVFLFYQDSWSTRIRILVFIIFFIVF